jgi:biotin transport system substrate-specific component
LWKSGPAALLGPTGGYLLGFVIAAWVIGLLVENYCAGKIWRLFAAAVTGMVIIYACGAIWLFNWFAVTGKAQSTATAVFGLGIAPFLLIDLLKAGVAAGIVGLISGRQKLCVVNL